MESNTSTMLGSLVKNILKYITSQLVNMEYVNFEMNHICQVEANYWDTFKCHIHCSVLLNIVFNNIYLYYKYSVLFDGKKENNTLSSYYYAFQEKPG